MGIFFHLHIPFTKVTIEELNVSDGFCEVCVVSYFKVMDDFYGLGYLRFSTNSRYDLVRKKNVVKGSFVSKKKTNCNHNWVLGIKINNLTFDET